MYRTVFLAILTAISENVLLLEEGKTNCFKIVLNISTNNREKHIFTVNMYQNEFMVGPVMKSFWHCFTVEPRFSQLLCEISHLKLFVFHSKKKRKKLPVKHEQYIFKKGKFKKIFRFVRTVKHVYLFV